MYISQKEQVLAILTESKPHEAVMKKSCYPPSVLRLLPSVLCLLFSVLCSLFLTGCYEPVDYPLLVSESPHQTGGIPPQQRIAGTSVQGRPIIYLVLGQGSDTVFIMATIHGNEPAGTPLVQRLNEYLQQNPDILTGRTVVLLPVANPDGMAANSRNNANSIDLNRNFDAANRIENKQSGQTALSEPESQAIKKLISQYTPDRIVSLHQVIDQNYAGLAALIPTGCIDYDGPGRQLAYHMAGYCNLPVKKLGSRPGSLGSYAGVTLGIPIITFEMQKNDSTLDAQTLWQQYGKAIVAAIVYPESIQ